MARRLKNNEDDEEKTDAGVKCQKKDIHVSKCDLKLFIFQVQLKKAEGRFHSDTKETVPPSGQEEKHTVTDSKQAQPDSPRVTKKQNRLSTMVSMMASMSVSWMSALLMAAGERTGETDTLIQIRVCVCVCVTMVRDELLVLMTEDKHVVFQSDEVQVLIIHLKHTQKIRNSLYRIHWSGDRA